MTNFIGNNVLPYYILPKLHKDIMKMSFENYWKIKKAYKEIIGLSNIDHFSISIVDKNYQMSILSFTPAIMYNACAEGWYIYNGSLSKTFYENLDMFVWDQCYDKRFYNRIKFLVEQRYGLNIGVSLVRKINGFHIIYCFGTKGNAETFLQEISPSKEYFLNIGDHCYNLLKTIYQQYSVDEDAPDIKKSGLMLLNGFGAENLTK
jgi:hypothetical protein